MFKSVFVHYFCDFANFVNPCVIERIPSDSYEPNGLIRIKWIGCIVMLDIWNWIVTCTTASHCLDPFWFNAHVICTKGHYCANNFHAIKSGRREAEFSHVHILQHGIVCVITLGRLSQTREDKVEGLAQVCRNAIPNVLELVQSCHKPSKWLKLTAWWHEIRLCCSKLMECRLTAIGHILFPWHAAISLLMGTYIVTMGKPYVQKD